MYRLISWSEQKEERFLFAFTVIEQLRGKIEKQISREGGRRLVQLLCDSEFHCVSRS